MRSKTKLKWFLVIIVLGAFCLIATRSNDPACRWRRALGARETFFSERYKRAWAHLPTFLQASLPKPILFEQIRFDAAIKIIDRGTAPPPAMPELERNVGDLSARVRLASCLAITSSDPASRSIWVPRLITELSQQFKRSHWLLKFHSRNPEFLFSMTDTLITTNPACLAFVGEWFRGFSSNSSVITPLPIPRPTKKYLQIRYTPANAPNLLGDTNAVPFLERNLHDESLRVRAAVAAAVAGFRTPTPDVIAVLQEGLKSPELICRRMTAVRLGGAGPAASNAIPALLEALRDENHYVRRYAADAIWKIDGDRSGAALATMKELIENPSLEAQWITAVIIKKWGSRAQSAIPLLEKRLDDLDAPSKRAFIETIMAIRKSTNSAAKD